MSNTNHASAESLSLTSAEMEAMLSMQPFDLPAPSGMTPMVMPRPLSALIALDLVERGLMSAEDADLLKESLMDDLLAS